MKIVVRSVFLLSNILLGAKYSVSNEGQHKSLRLLHIITVRKRSCGNVMFSQVCIKNSVHRGGCLLDTPLDRLGRHLPCPGQTRQAPLPLAGRHPPCQADTPPAGRHPFSRRLLQRTLRILLECILVQQKFAWKNLND